MYLSSDKYNNNNYPFPSREISPSKKGEEYCIKNAEAIYSLYKRGKTAFSEKASKAFNTLRLYANGQQDVTQYQTWLLDDPTSNGGTSATTWDETSVSRVAKKEGWFNISTDNVSPAPKIMAMLHGLFDDTEWDIFVDTIDQYSKKLLEKEKYLQIVQGSNQVWQDQYKQAAGIPIDQDVVYPKSKEEFDVSVATEGFKLNIAKAMEKLIDHTFDVSKWDTVLKRKLIDDLAAIGYAATRDFYDPEDGFFKTKYLDPAKLIMQYSIHSDYLDSEYGGYNSHITVSQLRQKLPDISEEELARLAKNNLGYEDNPATSREWSNQYSKIDPTTGMYNYDTFKVRTLECEWMDYETEKRLSINGIKGRSTYVKKGFDEDIKPLSKRQLSKGAKQETSYIVKRVPYQCTWVIGQQHVFDFGPVQIAPRPLPSKPRLSFHVEQLMQPSYMYQLKPMLDQIQMIWLRWQNSLAKMIERGHAINMSMLQNITDGDKKWKLGDVLKMWKQTGILPFMQSISGPYQGGDVTPIRPIDGGLGTRLQETVEAMTYQFKLIEDIVGFNPVSMGSTTPPDAAVRNVQAAMQGTNNVLKPLAKAVMEVKTGVAETVMSRLQIGLRASKKIRDNYSGVVSDVDIDLLQLADKDMVRYGLSMKPRPDAAFRAQLSEYVKAALQSGRDGKSGLEMPQAMFIDEQLYRGKNITEVRQQISYLMNKSKQEAMANEKENIDRQNQGLQTLEQQKEGAEARKFQATTQAEMAKIQAETQAELTIKRVDANISLLDKITDAALSSAGEGGDNSEAKRMLSLALNVIAVEGISNIDLAAKLGQAQATVAPVSPTLENAGEPISV